MNDPRLTQAGADDNSEDLSDIEPDLLLLTDYLANELSPDERAQVDQRLATDAEFARMARPLIEVWRMPLLPFEERILEQYGIATTAARGTSVSVRTQPRRAWTLSTSSERLLWGVAMAASFLFWLVKPTAFDYATRMAKRWQHGPVVASVPRGPTVVAAIPAPPPAVASVPQATAAPDLPAVSKAVTLNAGVVPSITVIEHAPNLLLYASRIPSHEELRNALRGRLLMADSGETLTVPLEDSAVVTLRGPARFKYVVPMPVLGFGASAELSGEVVVDVSAQERMMEIKTAAGRAWLQPGRYAVRADPVDGTLLVTVETGGAGLAAPGLRQNFELKPGQFGRIVPGGQPEHADGVGFPRVRVP